LRETLFFCTGIIAQKTRTQSYTQLQSGDIVVQINHTKSIKVNGDPCHSMWEAKYVIGLAAELEL
jgi:hypothetical protein